MRVGLTVNDRELDRIALKLPAARYRLNLWAAGACLLALLVAMPILAMFAIALGGDFGLWSHLLQTVIPRYLINTLILMVLVGSGVLFLGVSTAWLVTMCRFPGRRLFEWALVLPLAFPAYVVSYIYVDLFDYAGPLQAFLRDLFSWSRPNDYWFPEIRSLGGAAAILTAVLYPYVYLLARTAFLDQSVVTIEVGRTLGISAKRAFYKISIPLARPALAIGVALALMEVISDFGTVQQLAVETFTTGIYEVWLGMNQVGAAAQLASLLFGFVLLLIWLERSSRRGRRYHPAGRHFRDLPGFRLAGWRAVLAFVCCALPVLVGFAVPAWVLISWSAASWDVVSLRQYVDDLSNTLLLATTAALVAALAAVFMSYALRASSGPVLRIAARLAGSGYAIPGSVIAVGVLVPFAWIDNQVDGFFRANFGFSTGLLLSGSMAILVFAYLARFMALAFGAVGSSFGRVTRNMDGAARALGHSSWSTLRRIHLPMIRGGVLTGILLVFVEVMKELPATLILRPFDYSTLASRVYEYASDEQFEEIGIWALSIAAAGIIPVILLSRSIRHSRPGHPGES